MIVFIIKLVTIARNWGLTPVVNVQQKIPQSADIAAENIGRRIAIRKMIQAVTIALTAKIQTIKSIKKMQKLT